MKRLIGLFLLLLVSASPSCAVEPDELLKDPGLESRARSISSELRCLVCQNQSIDDSHAPLARDLRVLVRQKLIDGAGDDEIRNFLVDRYGDFILLKPRFSADTLILWFAPFMVLAFGGFSIFRVARRRAGLKSAPLDASERLHLDALLKEKDATKL
jgi:cytochrome c-type biogenesis protein CcmH